MANETTSSTISELYTEIVAEALFVASEQSVMRGLVRNYTIAGGGKSVEVPIYSTVSAAAVSEASDLSNTAVTVLASSSDCPVQALSYLNHAFSVQFHPEVVNETIQDWISIPKIKFDFDEAVGQKGISEIIEYQQKNRGLLINGAKLIYENWLNLIKKK